MAMTRSHDNELQLYAFDILALDGEDLRTIALMRRKANLARVLARRPEGIFVAPFEAGEIGADLFRAACNFGLEGLVSKRRDRPYRAGRSPDWVKMKNGKHPAMLRVKEAYSSACTHNKRDVRLIGAKADMRRSARDFAF